jgi:hypothetical protein
MRLGAKRVSSVQWFVGSSEDAPSPIESLTNGRVWGRAVVARAEADGEIGLRCGPSLNPGIVGLDHGRLGWTLSE